jgi:hypothetical protein
VLLLLTAAPSLRCSKVFAVDTAWATTTLPRYSTYTIGTTLVPIYYGYREGTPWYAIVGERERNLQKSCFLLLARSAADLWPQSAEFFPLSWSWLIASHSTKVEDSSPLFSATTIFFLFRLKISQLLQGEILSAATDFAVGICA